MAETTNPADRLSDSAHFVLDRIQNGTPEERASIRRGMEYIIKGLSTPDAATPDAPTDDQADLAAAGEPVTVRHGMEYITEMLSTPDDSTPDAPTDDEA